MSQDIRHINFKSSGIYLLFLGICIGLSACYTQKNLTGSECFDLRQYSVAKNKLPKEIDKERNPQQKSYLAYLAGRTEIALHNPKGAIPWFEKALELYEREEILFALAKAYKSNERYTEAKKAFELLNRKYKNDTYANHLQSIKSILQLNSNKPDPSYEVDRLHNQSQFAEYSPVVFDENFLVISADRSEENELLYPGTGKPFSDLFIYSLSGKSFQSLSNVINTEKHEGTACFTKDYSQIFFTRCENFNLQNEHCRIYYSERASGEWSEPQAIGFFPEDVNVGHPALMGKDSILVFAAAPFGNYDSYELYYSRRYPTGWSEAELLPPIINTEANEKFPVVHNDTLYFSSDHYNGFGGLDIYKTYLEPGGRWKKPELLPMPLNSGFDDFGLTFKDGEPNDQILQTGFFTSSRTDGIDRIYSFDKVKIAPPEEIEEEKEIEEPEVELLLFVAGTIADNETGEKLYKVKVQLILEEDEKQKNTNKKGQVIFDAERDVSYRAIFKKEGYYYKETTVSTKDLEIDPAETSYTVNFSEKLEPIKINKEVVLDNIYYDFNKWNIRQDAEPALDELSTLLNENPSIKLQLASHTDCRGETDYNYNLSSKRASSVMSYLIQKGISPSRLSSKGYGEDALIVSCECEDCSEEQHQDNRRTTFKVLSY